MRFGKICLGSAGVAVLAVGGFFTYALLRHSWEIHIDPPDMPGFSLVYEGFWKPSEKLIRLDVDREKAKHRKILDKYAKEPKTNDCEFD